jgi:uncharacterized protein (DUF1778 family)
MSPNVAHVKASVKYNRERVDQIMIKPDKQTGAVIRQAAHAAGKPLQRFIVDAVLEKIAQAEK